MARLRASTEIGTTRPPEDGSIVACPTCVDGHRRVGRHRLPCLDCLGSGVMGFGFTALHVFDEWIEGCGVDDSDSGGDH